MSTQNVNVARFARNVEWDFFCDFQTPCLSQKISFQILQTKRLELLKLNTKQGFWIQWISGQISFGYDTYDKNHVIFDILPDYSEGNNFRNFNFSEISTDLVFCRWANETDRLWAMPTYKFSRLFFMEPIRCQRIILCGPKLLRTHQFS